MAQSEHKIVRIVVVLVSFGLCLSSGRTVLELWQRKDVVNVRRQELLRLQHTKISLERELIRMKEDSYVERVAREKLGMIKPREFIVMLPEPEASANSGRKSVHTGPVWRQWLGMFF